MSDCQCLRSKSFLQNGYFEYSKSFLLTPKIFKLIFRTCLDRQMRTPTARVLTCLPNRTGPLTAPTRSSLWDRPVSMDLCISSCPLKRDLKCHHLILILLPRFGLFNFRARHANWKIAHPM